MSDTDLIPYIVRQGEYLSELAARFGFDPKKVWTHSKNQALRKLREDPDILHPGDVIYLPAPKPEWLPLKMGSTNSFVAPSAKVSVRVQLKAEGEPLADEPYVVFGAKVPPGSLDGEGNFEATVTTRVKVLVVRLTRRNEDHVVHVGHLDPPDEPNGMFQRLAMLGFCGEAATTRGPMTGELETALCEFQKANTLDVTGEIDDETVQKVLDAYGR